MKKMQHLHLLAAIALVILGTTSAFADVICDPATLTLDEVMPIGEVVIRYTGEGSAPVAGYNMDIQWDPMLATAEFTPPDTEPFGSALTFFFDTDDPGHVVIGSAIGGSHPGITSGELMKVTFTAVPNALGADSVIDLTVLALRDSGGLPITGGDTDVDGLLNVDMYYPTVTDVVIVNNTLGHTNDFVKDTDTITVTAKVVDYDSSFDESYIKANLSGLVSGGTAVTPDSYVAPFATWSITSATCSPTDDLITVTITATDPDFPTYEASGNVAITSDNTAPTALENFVVTPGHRQLHLVWEDIGPRDTNPLGVKFRYTTWGGYPYYDSEPDYPDDHTEGEEAKKEEVETFWDWVFEDWVIEDRDIYYLSGYVYDMALNYSPNGASNQGGATNYWLGDIDDNGAVDFLTDIYWLGESYGLTEGEDDFNEYCNVGPTDTYSPWGIPNPNFNDKVDFEDMMVFALNWNVVEFETKNLIGGTPVMAWRQVDETAWALSLVEKGGDLQGLNLKAELPEGVSCTVTRGELLAEQSVPVFLHNIPDRGIDAGLALFGQGAGFSGSGELVRVTLSKPVEDIRVSVTVRGADNKELSVELGTGSPETVPSVARFAQNYPNPFNPRTTLAYELPQERQVHLAIYAVDGTRVRTLVEGLREAGHHEVSWDGRDDIGRSMAAGTYFARISAGDLNQIKKMVLMK